MRLIVSILQGVFILFLIFIYIYILCLQIMADIVISEVLCCKCNKYRNLANKNLKVIVSDIFKDDELTNAKNKIYEVASKVLV